MYITYLCNMQLQILKYIYDETREVVAEFEYFINVKTRKVEVNKL